MGLKMKPDQNLLNIFIEMNFVVQYVVLLLLIVSLYSWSIIFRKLFFFSKIKSLNKIFLTNFWSGKSINEIYDTELKRTEESGSMTRIFMTGMTEYQKMRERRFADRVEFTEGMRRAMRASCLREKMYLETNISFFATVGSVSLYIGLFGTTWGLMHIFISNDNLQLGISSVLVDAGYSLIASLFGLFVAIPTNIAFNSFANKVDDLITEGEVFIEEFLNILNRNLKETQN